MIRQKDIVDHIASVTDFKKDHIEEVLEELFAVITEKCSSGEEVHLKAFGTFVPKIQEERVRTNPATRQKVTVPRTVSLLFRPTRSYKKLIDQTAKSAKK